MTSYEKLLPPTDGKKITQVNGKLQVPDNPVIPFIEGDGTGPDIWRASKLVLDEAVKKAYDGKNVSTGSKSMRARRQTKSMAGKCGCLTTRSKPSTSISSQ